jgi:Tol biopolymer transport system component
MNNRADIFLHDRAQGSTFLVSLSSSGEQGDANSFGSAVSTDGRYVVFESFASNLVPLDTNETWDVFVRDRVAGTTRLASRSTFGVQGRFDSTAPAISADGRFVAFTADADNLVPDDTNSAKDIIVRGPLR